MCGCVGLRWGSLWLLKVLDWVLHLECEGSFYGILAPRMRVGCLDEAPPALRSLKAATYELDKKNVESF